MAKSNRTLAAMTIGASPTVAAIMPNHAEGSPQAALPAP